MNKTDNIFQYLPKSRDRVQQPVSNVNTNNPPPKQEKKEKKREKSFVLEMKELKKEIDEEIKRDIMAGKIFEHPPAFHTNNKRTNMTTIIDSKKEF